MRVLQTVQTLSPETGGVARAVLSLSEGMQRLGVEVEIVTLDDPGAPWLRDLSLHVHALGEGITSYRYSRALKDWLAQNGRRFDSVIINGIWQHHSFAVWQNFHCSTVPYFVFPHGMLDPWFKRTFPLKHLKKWLYWPWADYRVLRDARAVIFTSEEERRLARKSFWLYRARETVSPLGIDPPAPDDGEARDAFAAKFPQIAGKRMLLFLGRLHPKKGCDLLLQAWAERPADFSLVIAGPDQVDWAATLHEKFGASRVVFTGMLQGDLKRGAFANAEAFILPSHQENFGLSVAEALSFGLPVLISNRVNIWREIEADRAGYVENDDLTGTARLLERWMRTPPGDRAAMRNNARRCFEKRYTLDRAAQSLLAILQTP